MTVFDLLFQLALGIAATSFIIRRDMRRLSPERFSRAWNTASFWNAVVVFGPVCLPVHFVRTRRTVWGLLLGLFWAAVVTVAVGILSDALMSVFGTAAIRHGAS
jgi:hypothetical protein